MTLVRHDSALPKSVAPARRPASLSARGLLIDWDPATYRQTLERFAGDRQIAVPHREAETGSPFPFRLMVLDAEVPPPIMLHPHWEQALAGFVREQARGLPLGAGNRNYKDRNPKCEVAVALTPLRVLAGERTTEELQAITSGLDLPWLRSYLRFRHETVIHSVLRMTPGETAAALRETADAVDRIGDVEGPAAEAVAVVRRLRQLFPKDRGILLAICMNLIRLDPGQAAVIPPGCLHTYLSGQAVVVMGTSDNALQAGLTREHVDLCELQHLTGGGQPQPSPLPVLDTGRGEQHIPLWSEDLDLRRVVVEDDPKPVRVGPFSVVLAALEPACITVDEVTADMEPEAKILYAGEPVTATLTGPSQVFVASTL
nr:type I phosphomannose isomerase catalytic subunit [Arthrobacter sp. zg-Y919]